MKTLGLFVVPCLLLGAGSASAESYISAADPSGSAMCFDASGNKAALSACASAEATKYLSLEDPSGMSMCFSDAGDKAPLTMCEVELTPAPVATRKPGSFYAMLSFFR